MTLSEVLAEAQLLSDLPLELARTTVQGLDYDSRRMQQGFVFFAFPGAKADGRAFASQAAEKGAIATVSELPAPDSLTGPWIQVAHGRQTLAMAARTFYGKLDEKLFLTGITGTNGKTTTAFLLDSVFRQAGLTTAMIGTIEYRMGSNALPAPNTTPESLDLARLFSELNSLGGTHVTMEVSSHALALGRVYGLHFHTAVFTNFSRDHLDYHGTMENYFAAKKLLLDGAGAPPPRFAVINRDDEWGRKLTTPGNATEVLWYGLGKDSMLRAKHIRCDRNGLRFNVAFEKTRFDVFSLLVGRFNVFNILAACGAAMTYQLPPDIIVRGIEACKGVPGRFERVDEGQPFLVIVDYSHTDDALRNAIAAARSLEPTRVITVFGCGGDRDRTKRPLMGQAASELSDVVVLTSDNPRSEDPLQIMNDVLVGIRRSDTKTIVEPDRAQAIYKAMEEARSGDLVLLAGKGHETYQIFADKTIHFDDREAARAALRLFGFRRETR
jgi:UDP-N-acetylmuramoyl-L-alanyl-D-glutamate--2,6-diaminopimelate ligase